MKQETIKIQVLNDTKLCVLPVLPDGKTVVPVESISGLTVSWGIHGHETEPVATTIENGYIVLPISATMPLGVYSVHMQGTINGDQWSDNRYEMFELTKYGEGIRYDRYYTTTVILGLPDEVLEQLKEEYAQKIAEYQHLIDELNRGEVATKSDLGLAPGETVAGLIKAGGGGGGGMTPEQYDAIAKKDDLPTDYATESSKGAIEGVVNKIHESVGEDPVEPVGDEPRPNLHQKMYMLAGMIGKKGDAELGEESLYAEVETVATTTNGKLDQILVAVTLNAAQADEDWQNVKPA